VKAGSPFKRVSVLALALIVLSSGCGKKESERADASGSARNTQRRPSSIDRYQWNLNTLVDPYLQRGHRDSVWDEPATNALAKFARIRADAEETDTGRSIITSYLREAVLKGCTDPMILYLHTRFVLGYQEDTTDALMADSYKKAAANLRQHPCAPIREFYISLRTSESINRATGGKATSPEVHQFRRAALASLHQSLRDPDIPTVEVYQACRDMLDGLNRNPTVPQVYRDLERPLLERWPGEPFVYQFKGGFHIDEAWRARGSGYADSVSQDGWKGFSDHLKLAAEALEQAWKLGPTNAVVAYQMMYVELGQGQGRDRLDLWFNRAMAIDTNYVAACRRKLFYLEPKWHGSAGEMLAFARECATSEKWGGEVPLLPLYAHDSLAGYAKRDGNTNYWKQSTVWPEIKSTLDRFFARNPDAVGWRHNYAWYAYHCGQWDDFNRQLPLFTFGTNYNYFGGRDTFERMVQHARTRASQPSP
jgi:hypothetical protein